MHICFICHEYPPGMHGGVGTVMQTLARALVERGHEVTVVGLYARDQRIEETDLGVRVIRIPRTRVRGTGFALNGARLRRTLLDIHRQSPIDVLEGTEPGLALLPKEFPVTRVIRMHGGHHFFSATLGNKPRAWRGWLEQRSFERADHLCAVSSFVAETTRGLLKLGDRPVEILHNPINLSRFHPQPVQLEQDGLIVFVGTVCEKKGVRQLIQAMPQIVRAVPYARLWVVGRDSQDPETGRSFTNVLRDLVTPEFKERVIFKGAVENAQVANVIAQAQVCVYPSHMEAMPLAWLEGMAMGKAVVASETGPGREAIEDGISGLLCNPHDPASIASRIIELLKDESLRRRLKGRARTRIEEQFSVDAMIERNEEFYARCARPAH